MTAPRVILVGGGFGGLYAACELTGAPVHLTLLRSGGAGVFLTNENTMDENLRGSRLTQWKRPNS